MIGRGKWSTRQANLHRGLAKMAAKQVHTGTSKETPAELPLDIDHQPVDMQEAIEMLRRAKRLIEDLEIERDEANATIAGWLAANGPGGWIDRLRKLRGNK